jgi:hypothetical protein
MREEGRGFVNRSAKIFPRRPGAHVVSKAIRLFFIGQNADGLWVARDAEGRVGGIFWCKRSAVNFADDKTAPVGCAKMFVSQRFELDIKNNGNPLATYLGAAKQALTRFRTTPTALRHPRPARRADDTPFLS